MKLIAGITAALLTVTLLAFGFSPAQANHGYAADIRTFCDAFPRTNPVEVGTRPRTRVRVNADNGRQPNSQIVIRIKRRGVPGTVARVTRRYWGGLDTFRLPRLPRGDYKVIVRAHPNNDRYMNCAARHGLRVRR